jgi:DNA repair photolyase
MSLIYVPKGPAREYADLALNLYKGCDHQCEYCYAPSFAYMMKNRAWSVEQFKNVVIRGKTNDSPETRKTKLLNQLRREASRLTDREVLYDGLNPILYYEDRILFSFTTDPYQPIEDEYHLTREALTILGEAGLRVTVLTKAASRAMKDLELFKKYNVEFAQTLCFMNDDIRKKWEPNADSIPSRFMALDIAREAGLPTWLSLEPVIDPDESLAVIERCRDKTDLIKVGPVDRRWNAELYNSIDWTKFLREALALLTDGKCDHYIKNHLWVHADDAIKSKFKKTSVPALEWKANIGQR